MLIFRDPSEKVAYLRHTFRKNCYLTHGSSEIPQKDDIIIIKFVANPYIIIDNPIESLFEGVCL